MESETPTTGTDAGGSAPVQETTASPAVDRSTLSDDELLGIGSHDREEPVETASDDSPKPVETKPDTQEPMQAEDEVADTLDDIPSAELKRLLEKEPALRKFYFREREFQKLFPRISEARELRAMFPTAQDAQEVAQQAASLFAFESAYVERPEDFIAGIAANKEAFARLAEAMPFAVYNSDPALYRAKFAEPAIRSLISNLADNAVSQNDSELADAVGVIVQRLGLKDQEPTAEGPGQNEPWRAEYEQLKREREEWNQATAKNFDASISRDFISDLQSRVSDEIKRLNPAMSEAAVELAHEQIMHGVLGRLESNKWLNEKARALKRSGGYDAAHLNQMVSLLSTHAASLISPTVSQVLNKWTNEIVRANAVERSEVKQKAGKPEVGSGNDVPRDTSGRFKKVNNDHAFYQKYSDQDILDGKHHQEA